MARFTEEDKRLANEYLDKVIKDAETALEIFKNLSMVVNNGNLEDMKEFFYGNAVEASKIAKDVCWQTEFYLKG